MIEDKELGLKIAESEDEELWENVRKEAELLIKQNLNNLKIQKAMKTMAEDKLKEMKGGNKDDNRNNRK